MSGRQTNVIDSNMQLLLVKDSYNIRCLPSMKNRHTYFYIVQKRLDLLKYLRKVSTTVKNAIHMIIFYPIFKLPSQFGGFQSLHFRWMTELFPSFFLFVSFLLHIFFIGFFFASFLLYISFISFKAITLFFPLCVFFTVWTGPGQTYMDSN